MIPLKHIIGQLTGTWKPKPSKIGRVIFHLSESSTGRQISDEVKRAREEYSQSVRSRTEAEIMKVKGEFTKTSLKQDGLCQSSPSIIALCVSNMLSSGKIRKTKKIGHSTLYEVVR